MYGKVSNDINQPSFFFTVTVVVTTKIKTALRVLAVVISEYHKKKMTFI